jgi:single-strand DNA-binding protein
MSNVFAGGGNLGDSPALKRVRVGSDTRSVLEMSVYFDRPVPVGDGKFEDKGGFWLRVNLWDKRAEVAAQLLQKGARIRTEGELTYATWADKDTQAPRSAFVLRADWIALDPIRVAEVTFKESSGRPAPEPDRESDAVYAGDEHLF